MIFSIILFGLFFVNFINAAEQTIGSGIQNQCITLKQVEAITTTRDYEGFL